MDVPSSEQVEHVTDELAAQRTEHEIEEATAVICDEVADATEAAEEATEAAEEATEAAGVAAEAATTAAVASIATAITEDALAERITDKVLAAMDARAAVVEPEPIAEQLAESSGDGTEVDEPPKQNSFLHRKAF